MLRDWTGCGELCRVCGLSVWPVCGWSVFACVAGAVWPVWPCVRWCGHEKGGARGGPPPLWCAGGGVLLSHTLAGAVPSALAVLASGFGKGKSGRVPAAVAAATRAGPGAVPGWAGVGFGYRIADACHRDPSPGLPARERGGCVGSVGPLVPVGFTPLRGVHVRSINPVVFGGPSHREGGGELVLKRASRLDAFSGYPSRT